MANTLTSILPVIYEAADTVSRELTGFIPAVFRNSTAERAGLNQTITYPVVPTMAAADITPAATPSTGTDITIGTGTMTISKNILGNKEARACPSSGASIPSKIRETGKS